MLLIIVHDNVRGNTTEKPVLVPILWLHVYLSQLVNYSKLVNYTVTSASNSHVDLVAWSRFHFPCQYQLRHSSVSFLSVNFTLNVKSTLPNNSRVNFTPQSKVHHVRGEYLKVGFRPSTCLRDER